MTPATFEQRRLVRKNVVVPMGRHVNCELQPGYVLRVADHGQVEVVLTDGRRVLATPEELHAA